MTGFDKEEVAELRRVLKDTAKDLRSLRKRRKEETGIDWIARLRTALLDHADALDEWDDWLEGDHVIAAPTFTDCEHISKALGVHFGLFPKPTELAFVQALHHAMGEL